jgi:ATP-dependent helicase Lhr and Lhr-like helicase
MVDAGAALARDDRPAVLLLAGRPWVVSHIDWPARIAYVQPTMDEGKSRWLGSGQPLHFRLCQAVAEVLAGGGEELGLSKRATTKLQEIRRDYTWLEPGTTAVVQSPEGRLAWWTFAGLRANAALAAGLRERGVTVGRVDNYAIALAAGVTSREVEDAIGCWLSRNSTIPLIDLLGFCR